MHHNWSRWIRTEIFNVFLTFVYVSVLRAFFSVYVFCCAAAMAYFLALLQKVTKRASMAAMRPSARWLLNRSAGNSLLFSILNCSIHYHSMSSLCVREFVPQRPRRRREEAQRERSPKSESRKTVGFKDWSGALALRMKHSLKHDPPRRAKDPSTNASDKTKWHNLRIRTSRNVNKCNVTIHGGRNIMQSAKNPSKRSSDIQNFPFARMWHVLFTSYSLSLIKSWGWRSLWS